MRKAMFFLAVFALAAPLWAADPIIGTWKLNVEKTRELNSGKSQNPESAADTIKEQTEVYRNLDSERIEITLTRTRTDGTSSVSKLVWPAQGGAVTFLQGDPRGRSLVETLIAPGEWYVTYMREGKQYMTLHKAVSKDGKTLRQTFKYLDRDGKLLEGTTIYDKQ
jgi:hypothetical protein